MNLEVRHLRLIEAIHEEKSLTRAGARLFLTQSALSHQLRDIEEKLGTPLFLRVNKRLVLTPAGQRVLTASRSILENLRLTEEDISRIASNKQGSLRITTQCYTCYHWLPDVLAQYRKLHPNVDVEILLEATRKPIEALLDGRVDVAVLHKPGKNKDLQLRPLFRDELVMVASPEHPLARKRYVEPSDFTDQVLILHSPPEENFFVQEVLVPAGVRAKEFWQVQITEGILSMVKAGLGVSVLANWAVAAEVRSGLVRAVPVTRRGVRRLWNAATLKGKSPRYLTDFIDLVARQASPLPRKMRKTH